MGIFYGPMNLSKKLAKRAAATRANPPSTIQLPGGVVMKAFDFRITAVDKHGQPTAFERAEPGSDSDAILWADPDFMDKRLRSDLDARFKARIEASIEGPEVVDEKYTTSKRDIETVTKHRAHGVSTYSIEGRAESRDYPAVPTPGIRVSDVVENKNVTCGYEPCDGGPCLHEEEHAERERGPAHAPGHE